MKFPVLLTYCLLSVHSCHNRVGNTTDCTNRSRWDVKTLTDKSAAKINFNPIAISIADLLKMVPEKIIDFSTPRFGIEFKTYSVKCYINEWKQKKDGDLHLVIADIYDTTKTMLAEIPDPECGAAQKSKYKNQFVADRKMLTSFFDSSDKIKSGVYEITGVAFFDKVKNQACAAASGIEIHPILSISIVTEK